MVGLGGPGLAGVFAGDGGGVGAADGVLRVVVIEPVHIGAEHEGLAGGEFVIETGVDEGLAVVAGDIEAAIGGEDEGGEGGGEEGGAVLAGVIGGGEEEGSVLDERAAGGAGELLERIGNVDGADVGEAGRGDAGGDGGRAVAFGGERAGLHGAGAVHVEGFAVELVGAGFGDDVDGGAGGPAELGGEGVGEDGHFLDGTDGDGGNHGLAAPGFVVIGAIKGDGGLAAAADAGDEIGGVDEEVAGAFGLAEGSVEERERSYFSAEDGGLVDAGGIETLAELGVGADAFDGAEDGDFGLGCADGEFNAESGGFAGSEGDIGAFFGGEAGLGNGEGIGGERGG